MSSERLKHIPIGFLGLSTLVSNLCFINTDITIYHFGVLTSAMHTAWVRQVAGRLKSDHRYSAKFVYNNSPWPASPTDKQRERMEAKAQAVLDTRAKFSNSSLAELYDPTAMPPALYKAHSELDRAVDHCYRTEPFANDRERVEFLFRLYEKLCSPLTAVVPRTRRRHQRYQTEDEP